MMMTGEPLTVLRVQRREDFVLTSGVETLAKRAYAYIEAGFPVHLSGQAGTGKTTMAMHLAATRGRPVVLIYGDENSARRIWSGARRGLVRSVWSIITFARCSRRRKIFSVNGWTNA
jgi:predicted ATP-dependent serine protease